MELQLHTKMLSEARGRIHLLPEEARETLVALVDRAEESMRAIRELECVCEDELASARIIARYQEFESEARRREAIEGCHPARRCENNEQGFGAKPKVV